MGDYRDIAAIADTWEQESEALALAQAAVSLRALEQHIARLILRGLGD